MLTSDVRRPNLSRRVLAASAALVFILAGCSDDSDDSADNATEVTTTTVPDESSDTSTGDTNGDDDTGTGDRETLRILVSNDDSYSAPGIDALVEGLRTLDDVELIVVAPADERSGTGGNTTDGPLETTEVETASGYPAQAVDGFPADTIRVAIDELGVEPHLVITGINAGQNLGPIIDISGTVGAARAAVARDIPALATSQGMEGSHDAELHFEIAVSIIVDWVRDNRDALLAGDLPVEVLSLNVPSCGSTPIRGLAETIEPDFAAEGADALRVDVDCTSEVPITDLDGDVEIFNNGYATMGVVPSEPAAPAGE